MLVATFGPSTTWQGREIIWETDHFVLVDHGAIPAAGVLDYDRRGQLLWADPALRSWAFEVDLWENGGRSSLTPVTAGGAAPGARTAGAQPAGHVPRHGGIPIWVIVVIVVGVVALIAGVALALALPAVLTRTTQTLAQDMMVRANVHEIQAGIESYAAEHGGRYPGPGEVDPVDLSRYITIWPQNPYTQLPMADGGGEGNFRYDLSADGGAYRLIGYGRDGKVVIELSGGRQDTV